MALLRGIIDRLSLAFFIIAAGAAPSFMTQYQQQVGGRLDQVRADLAAFQSIADQRHGGSLANLVEHHLASSDNTFREEGDAIEAMMVEESRLASAHEALDTDLARQIWYLAGNADTAVMESTWTLFDPSFALDAQGLLFALLAGGGVWLVLMLVFGAVGAVFRRRAYRRAR